ncbi:MAG: M48 family metalloprotease [Nitrososphaerota archaeon]|nr:M48 family metalloprotease [Nitrososphaerota archaeon]MDG7013658.1 M48 family metalloprotease [Nitrososphaerota archaeon]MDG7025929.1 M48 family metalloprotease [Nitrososphaerota archaeon]
MSVALYAKITALFFVLTALLMVIGYLVGWYFFGDPVAFVGLALALAAVVNFVSYYYSDSLVLRMSKVKIVQENEYPTLFRIVKNVAQKANIPMPRVGVVDSPQPNAFATGRGPNRAVVCTTSSILQTLTPDELEAVIGHEIGHVVHRDVLMSSVAATMAGAISYIGQIAMFSMIFGGGGRNRNGGSPLALLAIILVPLGATFVQLGISRNDEYSADEYGAKLTKNPAGLVTALEKITAKAQTRPIATRASKAPSPATASLWIVNPFRGNSLAEMFSTHPSLPHRVERLRKVGRQMNVYVP